MWLQGNETALSHPLESCLSSSGLHSESEIETLLEAETEAVVVDKALADSHWEVHLS